MATTIQNIELPKKPRARDTSGNNNHGEIYSGRGLEFDGVTDYLNAGVAFSETNHTVAFWAMSNDNDDSSFFADTRDVNEDGLFIGFNANNIIQARVNDAATLTSTSSYTNTWVRVVHTYDGTTQKIYINGVLDVSQSVTETLNTTRSLIIGRKNYGAANWFDGYLSDGQFWDAAWTQTDVTYDYLNPESLALNASGSALTEGNLKLWYPMQDGHRGQQSYILDGANTGLGVELIENNDFSSVDNWNAGIGWEVLGNDKATNDGTGGILRQSNTVPLNTRFKVVFTVADYVTGNIQIKFAPVGQSVAITGNNTYTVYTAGDNNSNDDFQIIATSGFVGSITNISVKAINDKHHATTVFYGDELVTNGEFTNNITDGWTVDATRGSYAHDTGRIKITNNAASSYPNCSQDIATVIGRTYRVRGGVEIGTATTVEIRALRSGDNASQQLSADGNIDFTFVADQTSTKLLCYLWAPTGNTAEYVFFDNISFQEVGVASGWTDADQQLHIPQTALQSYNELLWCTASEGTNAIVEVADNSNLDVDALDFSISCWIYPVTESDYLPILFKGGAGVEGYTLVINPSNKIALNLNDGTSNNGYTNLTDAAVPSGEWSHVVMTCDRSSSTGIKCYLNGVLQTATADPTGENEDISNTQPFRLLGFNTGNTDSFSGTGTEFMLFKDSILSSSEVLELYNDGKALDGTTHSLFPTKCTAYYRNNGLSSWPNLATVADSGATSTAAAAGAVSAGGIETILIPEGVDTTRDSQGFLMNKKRSTSSLNLTTNTIEDGIGDGNMVKVGNVDLGTTDFSICFWAYKFRDWDEQWVISQYTDSSNRWYIRVNNLNPPNLHVFALVSGSAVLQDTDNTSLDGSAYIENWMHVALTVDRSDTSNGIQWYINGEATSNGGVSAGQTGTSLSSTNNLTIGADKNPNFSDHHFDGKIDGVLVYTDRLLDSTEVRQNYNATKRAHN